MIRINLLPQKKQLRRRGEVGAPADDGGGGESQLWLLFVLGAVLLEVFILLFVYKNKQDQLAQVVRQNAVLEDNIASIKKETAQHPAIKAQLKELKDREEAISKLQSARTGPTATMLELSHMLTPGRLPAERDRERIEQLKRDNPSAVPNIAWDPRRLWLSAYRENNRTLKLSGYARDGEDVSEFLRRLSLSDYFYEVKLLPAQKAMDAASKLELVRFEMSAKVRY